MLGHVLQDRYCCRHEEAMPSLCFKWPHHAWPFTTARASDWYSPLSAGLAASQLMSQKIRVEAQMFPAALPNFIVCLPVFSAV